MLSFHSFSIFVVINGYESCNEWPFQANNKHHAWAFCPGCLGEQFSPCLLRSPSRPSLEESALPAWPTLDSVVRVDERTGALTARVPLPVTVGRFGFTPTLALLYHSARRNSPFGWGWGLDVPSIARCTTPKVPRYSETDDDVFVLEHGRCDEQRHGEQGHVGQGMFASDTCSGDIVHDTAADTNAPDTVADAATAADAADPLGGSSFDHEELVAASRANGGWVDDRFVLGDYLVQRYRRRLETCHDRIEHWVHQPSGQTHWRVIDRNNVTSLYGSTDETRVCDPSDPTRVARWLLAERFDDRGNIMRYGYKRENIDGVDLSSVFERGRRDDPDAHGGMRYLKRIQYANSAPHDRFNWHYEIVFDYGEHDTDNPRSTEDRPWLVRPDPYSDHRNGFECRVWRRCHRVLMFHRFAELGSEEALVGATRLQFREQDGVSMLASIDRVGRLRSANISAERGLPPLVMSYEKLATSPRFGTIDADSVLHALLDPEAVVRWMDVEGVGAPGLVVRSGVRTQYIGNLGGGSFRDPEPLSGDVQRAFEEPVIDLTTAQAAHRSAVTHEREYVPSTTLRLTADVNHDDPFVGYIDLNGDHADDVVVADDRVIRWYPSQGEDGFADPIVLHLDPRDVATPHRLHVDARQSFHLADMNGDGLADLVRVRSGEVVYWPNRGRGRFGSAIVMANSPDFDRDPSGGPHGGAGVLLADLTGNGLSDVISVADEKVAIWLNENGNGFVPVESIAAPGLRSLSKDVGVVDLFGSGPSCVVWVDSTETPTVRYLAPFGGRRSGLLTAVSNNSGAEAHVTYVTATELWERDRREGVDWVTTSAASVDVVQRIEILDDVSGTHRSLAYRFRHAAFDDHARMFAGFAYVERADGDGVPEIVTRTLRHTGVVIDGRDAAELLVEKGVVPRVLPCVAMTPSEARALRGLLVSREVLFVTGDRTHRRVASHSWDWRVRELQPARADRPSVHEVRLCEVVDQEFGSSPDDVRVIHRLMLESDDYGSTTLYARVGYGARGERHQLQTATKVIVTAVSVANHADQSTWYRVGVPLGHTVWEIEGLTPRDDRFSADELREALESAVDATVTSAGSGATHEQRTRAGVVKTLVERVRVRYLSNDLARALDHGSVESRALVGRTENLVFDDKTLSCYPNVDAAKTLLSSHGRYHLDNEGWWSALERYSYDASKFYAVNAVTNPHGGTTRLRYDSAMLAIVEAIDPFGNISTARIHPRTRVPWLITDENGNVWGTRFDALGAVLSKVILGKPDSDPLDIMAKDAFEASAKDDPTTVVTYDLDAWLTAGTPVWRRVRTRQLHSDRDTPIEEWIEHFDGFGRVAATAIRQDDGRWLIHDVVERDCRGNVTRVAEPFYSDTSWPESNERKQALDNAKSLIRDPLGRVVRIDHVDGTTTGVERSPWRIAHWDRNDTVVESAWYKQRQSENRGRAGDLHSREMTLRQHRSRAAALAVAHARTPTVEHLDAFGNVVVVQQFISEREVIERVFHRDWRGQTTAVIDEDGERLWTAVRDLLGRPIATRHASGAETLQIWDALRNLVWSCDATGSAIRVDHDAAGRPTHVYEEDASGETTLIERTIWGGGDLEVSNAAEKNLVGAPAISLTNAGVVQFERDVFGHPTKETLRLPARDVVRLHLEAAETAVHADQVEILLDATGEGGRGGLASSASSIGTSRDVLGRVTTRVSPVGTKVMFRRSVDGCVKAIDLQQAGGDPLPIVSSVERDDHRRFLTIRLGASIALNREFDLAGNVIALTAWARGQDRPLQDACVVYDPEGNVSSVLEKGQLMTSCVYDASYRLTKLEGIEPVDEGDSRIGMRRFSKTYTYDNNSNVLVERHRADADESEIRRRYGPGSVLQHESSSDGVATDYAHDAMGRLVGAGDERFSWDARSRLVGLESTDSRTVFSHLPADILTARPSSDTSRESPMRDARQGRRWSSGDPMHLPERARVLDRPAYRRRTMRDSGEVIDVVRVGEFERSVELVNGAIVREIHSTVVSLDNVVVAVVRHALTRADVSQYDVDRSIRFQLVDVHGSPVVEVAENGDVIDQEWFLPTGQTLHRRGRSIEELEAKRLGFRASWRDAGTDVVQVDGRWYLPRIRRFFDAISNCCSCCYGIEPYVGRCFYDSTCDDRSLAPSPLR